MPTKARITIADDSELRTKLDAEYERSTQVELASFFDGLQGFHKKPFYSMKPIS